MTFGAEELQRVIHRFGEHLEAHRESLNRLNVYPVPDGDTGTNMALTVEATTSELAHASGMVEVAKAIAHGSLMGARGNSGVILSQILRGLTDRFRDTERVGVAEFTEALDWASQAAYGAVLRPQEGTILTVLREAAEAAAEGQAADTDLAGFLREVYDRAEKALEATPSQLPVLSEAGVVDAGGAGLLLLFAAFVEEISEESVDLPMEIFAAIPTLSDLRVGRHEDVSDVRYEVMFFLEAVDGELPRFREAWSQLGDSIVVVGGNGTYNCHIHTDDIGGSIEAGIAAGRPYRIQITDLYEQMSRNGRAGYEPLTFAADAEIGVVPVAAGEGLVEMFRQLGAQTVVTGGQSENPSTQELLDAVSEVPAGVVVLLPNNRNIVPVAEQVDALSHKRVLVVPTSSIMQGLAAMLEYLPTAASEEVVGRMTEAAQSVFEGEVIRAVRAATSPAGPVEPGDWLGITNGGITAVEAAQDDALMALLQKMVTATSELVTVITGADAQEEATNKAVAWLAERWPDVEVEVAVGDQPLYPYYVSVE